MMKNSALTLSNKSIGSSQTLNLSELFAKLDAAVSKLSIRKFIVFDFSNEISNFTDSVIYSNWTSSILDCGFDFVQFFENDIKPKVLKSITPFTYQFPKPQIDKEVNQQQFIADLKLFDGLIIPIHGPADKKCCLILGDLGAELTTEQVAIIQNTAFESLDKFYKNKFTFVSNHFGLTTAQANILQYLSEGKLINEISELLDLSEHAINLLQINATSKLECSTSVQAVVKALRYGLIK